MEKSPQKHLLGLPLISWGAISIYVIITVLFFYYYPCWEERRASIFDWLITIWSASDAKSDMQHGFLIPLLCGYMTWHAAKKMKGIEIKPSLHGLWLILLGCIMALATVRSQQPRLGAASFPILLLGCVWYYWGTKVALRCAFPFLFFWMSIHIPGLQQATTGMQLFSAKAAHWGAGVFGIQTQLIGTTVCSVTGDWDSFNIAGGCSGIRSLMALLMISVAWAYLADHLAMWKRVILALSALPLAVIGNAIRVTSIFICAEYIDPAFAGKAWHDWSGLLFFFPATLLGLTILYSCLAGEIPLIKKRKVTVRKHLSTAPREKGDAQ